MLKITTRRLIPLLLALLLAFSLTGCGNDAQKTEEGSKKDAQTAETKSDTKTDTKSADTSSRLTMYVGLGNTSYYPQLHDMILKNTGIDVQYVELNTKDTTTMMQDMIRNYDLPADIVITASPTAKEDQKNAFLDLASYSNLPDLFTATRIQEISIDGAVYQLPFSTRLIGIEYNKTLLEELGMQVPRSFDEMVALKEVCEAAGYTFAITAGVATGHGMNYLFHLMGSQYLSTPDGTAWFEKYRAGETSIDEFAAQAEYFRKYVEAGLFGTFHDTDWLARTEFNKQRALFYYNIINDAEPYDGFRYNADGTIYGATYTDGALEVVEDDAGDAVLYEGEYVYYDESKEEYKGLQRYTVPGAQVLHDTCATMPWITQSGTSNCFAQYDNMHVALDKKLAETGNEVKLEQAIQVLEYMLSDEAIKLFTDMYADGYLSTNDFTIDESRVYYDCAQTIQSGYVMPWYYSEFDMESIVNVGQKVNEYIRGDEGSSMESVLAELDLRNTNYVNSESEVYTVVTERLEFEDTARLDAIAGAVAVQSAIDAAGLSETVDAALMPYINSITDISDVKMVPVVQRRLYVGDIDSSMLNSMIPNNISDVSAIRMTGKEIKALVEKGYNSLADIGYDGTFPYKLVLKGDAELKDDAEYLVAVCAQVLETSEYAAFEDAGKVLTQSDGSALTGALADGLTAYFAAHASIAPDNLPWDN